MTWRGVAATEAMAGEVIIRISSEFWRGHRICVPVKVVTIIMRRRIDYFDNEAPLLHLEVGFGSRLQKIWFSALHLPQPRLSRLIWFTYPYVKKPIQNWLINIHLAFYFVCTQFAWNHDKWIKWTEPNGSYGSFGYRLCAKIAINLQPNEPIEPNEPN